jgi:murein DD-endopeptidase MepM/ murein hydrolase activator NlpD
MACLVQWFRSPLPRAAAFTLMTIGVGACSGETSRFNDNPFSSRSSPEATASVPPVGPAGRVESYPLPQQTAATPGVAGGGRGLASYTPNAAPVRVASAEMPEVTGGISAPKPVAAPSGHWNWNGGTPITVAPGETIDTIARRYGVPAPAIMKANNLTPPALIRPGQQLVIPRYEAARASPASPAKIAPATPVSHAHAAVHVVAAGETLSKISRLYGKPVGELARANHIPVTARLNVGDRLVIPGVRASSVKSTPTPEVAQAAPTPPPQTAEATPSASVFTPVAGEPTPAEPAKVAEDNPSLPKFRWPANGRVIGAFGPSANGQQNDGINIAVPENTPVKAAEDGVVAYAGSELKGYGNLVLVRHPNGFVTAYAHAKELLVKRGDAVKRGQVIARSGQSGNVNAPQLHFEIRKGAAPVDPTKYLSGA